MLGSKDIYGPLAFTVTILSAVVADASQCSFYDFCPALTNDKEVLNVHIIPHSHDDTGWLKTVDQYFLGSDQGTQRAAVRYTIETVVKALKKDPKKKYIQVETAFFWRWWNDQTSETKEVVKKLVDRGQFEFIGGGWCMNDEAASHYTDIVHQMSLGLRFINDTFGPCAAPKVAWQIDPFGHSREQANLFYEMAFDGLFFGRLDYREKDQRLLAKRGEMLWQTTSKGNNGNFDADETSLFTGVLYNFYSPPPGFCFDLLCNDEPIKDDPDLEDYNVDKRVAEFVKYVKGQNENYRTNNVAITAGMDFHYQAAHSWFKNLDKLIAYTNQGTAQHGVHLTYSTPSCYLKALHDFNISWPTKTDDFFPYASDPHAYWTGYFTSRPTSKRMIRDTSAILHVAKQLASFQPEDSLMGEALESLSESVAVTQHHDAVTGTEKQHVAEDYHYRLSRSIGQFENALEGSTLCPLVNVSQCKFSEDHSEQLQDFTVSVYNPLAWPRNSSITVPVTSETPGAGKFWSVVRSDGTEVTIQVVPVPEAILRAPGRDSKANFNLYFIAEDLAPMEFTSYRVTMTNVPPPRRIAGSTLKWNYNPYQGMLTIKRGHKSEPVNIKNEFLYYLGHDGDNQKFENRASGAYIFRPSDDNTARALKPLTDYKAFEGELYVEIHQEFEMNVSQVIRVPTHSGEPDFYNLWDAEVEWMVGPISIEDGIGKEFIHRVSIDGLSNQGEFYTDSNGRQFVRRLRDQRPSYNPLNASIEEPVSSNYYPIDGALFIEDDRHRLAVVTDRAQGGSSLSDGEVELMVHRRLLHDDAFGVGEALNETAFGGEGLVARGKHKILLDDTEEGKSRLRLAMNDVNTPVLVTFGTGSLYGSQSRNVKSLPENVHLLTLEPISGGSYIIRLEHIYDRGDTDDILSEPVDVDLKGFIESLGLKGTLDWIKEASLGGNVWKEDIERMVFDSEVNDINGFWSEHKLREQNGGTLMDFGSIQLKPFQIRTFQFHMT